MKRAAPALVTLLACTGASPPPENSCNISGWGSAPRTVVRAAPAPGAKVLAVLPHRPAQEGGQDINGSFPEFRITAARDGWFRIDQASYGDYGDPTPRRPLYSGKGWVRGDQIGGQLYSGRLHVAPSQRARSRPYGMEPDSVSIRRLINCRGNWARIEADIGTGWVQGLCGNQVTTCG